MKKTLLILVLLPTCLFAQKAPSSTSLGFDNPLFIFFIIGLLLISILIVAAVLKIPRIAKYQRSQLMFLALLAKDKGVPIEKVRTILHDADPAILADPDFEPLIK